MSRVMSPVTRVHTHQSFFSFKALKEMQFKRTLAMNDYFKSYQELVFLSREDPKHLRMKKCCMQMLQAASA